jgi:protein subunit release factor A
MLDPKELRIDTYSNGKDFAMTITHIPTGTVVRSGLEGSPTRSQHRLKEQLLKLLEAKLEQLK